VIVLLVAGWHYWVLYSSLTNARDDLLGAETRLTAAGLDVSSSDLDVVDSRAHSADANLGRADSHLRYDPLIQVAKHLPWAGPQVKATDEFVTMSRLLVKIEAEVSADARRALALREHPPKDQPLTGALVDLLNEIQPSLSRIQGLTRQLLDARLRLGDAHLLPPLASARARLDQELPRLANTVDQMAVAQRVLPGILGFDGDRHYLVLALNNDELQPGGGVVTAAGVLPVSKGTNQPADFTDSTLWATEWKARGGAYIQSPGPLDRYLLKGFTWNLLLSDWSPNFPTWSQQAAEFYQLVHGKQDLDGVVAVDLVALERLLAVTGPKTIPVEGRGNVTFTAQNAVLELEGLTRPSFEPASDRKSVVGDLAQAVLTDLVHLPSSKWAKAVNTVRALGHQGDIQVLSYDAGEQTLIRDVGWDGRLRNQPGDYLNFNEASVNSTKLNLILQRSGTLHIDINQVGDVQHDLVLQYANPLPEWAKGKDPNVVRQLMLGGLYGGYLRVFGPTGTSGFIAERNGQAIGIDDSGEDAGKRWFGVFMPLASGQQANMRFRWSSQVGLTGEGRNHYALYIQKQAGTAGLCLAIDVQRDRHSPHTLRITGGRRDAQGRICITSDVTVTADF
jgi:hypothetical protein